MSKDRCGGKKVFVSADRAADLMIDRAWFNRSLVHDMTKRAHHGGLSVRHGRPGLIRV